MILSVMQQPIKRTLTDVVTSLTSVIVCFDWLLHNVKNHEVCAFNSCMCVTKSMLSLKLNQFW